MVSRSPAPRRRPSTEVRGLLVTAAQSLFSTRGYEGTTTKEVALAAGVSEALLFTNFQSKENLFAIAVVDPFTELVTNYSDLWGEPDPNSSLEDRVRTFVERLYELAEQNRALLLTALAHHTTNGTGPENQILDRVAQAFQSMQNSNALATTAAAYRLDMPASIAASTGMILGVALLEAVIFPAGARRPGRDRLTEEMTQMVVDHALRRADLTR